MTKEARLREAERVELVYYWALGQIAASTYSDARDLWSRVPKNASARTIERWWLRALLRLVTLGRKDARKLAVAYYRLIRALRTGESISLPNEEADTVSLETLRDEFDEVVSSVDPAAVGNPAAEELPSEQATPPSHSDAEFEDDEDIPLRDMPNLDSEMDRQEREALKFLTEQLDSLGAETLMEKLDALEQSGDIEQDQAAEVHDLIGRQQAAWAEKISQDAARGLVYSMGLSDPKAIGWVRYSQTGTPCGFCAMLISREVFYKSASTASGESPDHYHPNCHCVAVPVFSKQQFDNSDLFALNRELRALWDEIASEHGQEEARRIWRNYLKKYFKKKKDAAQAVAA